MKKIGIFLGEFSRAARPLDFWYNNIWDSTRGLTGSDLSLVMLSSILAKRGCDVHLFTCMAEKHNVPSTWEGVHLYNIEDRFKVVDDSFNTLISLNEPDVFFGLTDKPLRILWAFLNDFNFCRAGYENNIDIGLGVCDKHLDYLKKLMPEKEHHKWSVLGLGCSPEWYEDKRVEGRVRFCSSVDRGLHNLLQVWPKIKAAVPYATLRIFYHFDYGNIENLEPNIANGPVAVEEYVVDYSKSTVEVGHRIRWIRNAIKKLKSFGVEHVGSISANQMKKEMSYASVLGYPCDTVAFSEGFSTVLIQGCASYSCVCTTNVDCLGEIYENSGALITKMPITNNL